MPSRLTALKPVKVNVTEYVPGRRSTILYCPVPSVTTDRVFSIRAGLDASTVTPGRTAPDASFTMPAIDPWAYATDGIVMIDPSTKRIRNHARISPPSSLFFAQVGKRRPL